MKIDGIRYFVFYRAEGKKDNPRLNEDTAGQFGKGVYFAMTKDTAKSFRDPPGVIFKFYIQPNIFIERLKPIIISKDEIIGFIDSSVDRFIEHLRYDKGYGENSFCVIGPIPDHEYRFQVMIDKEALMQLIEENYLRYNKEEEF